MSLKNRLLLFDLGLLETVWIHEAKFSYRTPDHTFDSWLEAFRQYEMRHIRVSWSDFNTFGEIKPL